MAGAAPSTVRRPMSAVTKHVLLLCPGSKVALTRALAAAITARGGRLTGWESDPFSPAAPLCHDHVSGGPIDDDASVERLLAWARAEGVSVIVPSRHDDLPALSQARDRFATSGITLAVSAPETIAVCHDKVATHAWLEGRGFPVPRQCTAAQLSGHGLAGRFPLVAKDPRGSGSRSIHICRRAADLEGLPGAWIVQDCAPGTEYTINTYAARDGRCLAEIPHERMLVGDGEVVRGRTARIPALMEIARRITESLPGARGPLNIQVFWDAPNQRATVIEINPRFGGGYPLAHEAGGSFAEWLLAEYIDGRTLPRLDAWEDGLLMVRYRESRFFRPA